MEAASFDLDGTLIRSTETRERSLEFARNTVDPALPRPPVETYQRAFRAALEDRLPETAWELPVRRTAFERAFVAAGSRPSPSVLEAFVIAYRGRRLERLEPREGAFDLLSKLRDTDRRTVVVTNGPAGLQQEKLRRTGLEPAIDATVVAGRCGRMKPDSRPFEIALERVGAAVEGAVHVGDSWRDVDGALRAGLCPILLSNGDESVNRRPDSKIDRVPNCQSLTDVSRRILD